MDAAQPFIDKIQNLRVKLDNCDEQIGEALVGVKRHFRELETGKELSIENRAAAVEELEHAQKSVNNICKTANEVSTQLTDAKKELKGYIREQPGRTYQHDSGIASFGSMKLNSTRNSTGSQVGSQYEVTAICQEESKQGACSAMPMQNNLSRSAGEHPDADSDEDNAAVGSGVFNLKPTEDFPDKDSEA